MEAQSDPLRPQQGHFQSKFTLKMASKLNQAVPVEPLKGLFSKNPKLASIDTSMIAQLPRMTPSMLSRRQAFLQFSRCHLELYLRQDTMYIAYELFCKIHQEEELRTVKRWKIYCACMFLAMKYEEIYPCSLDMLMSFTGWNIRKQEYRILELLVLKLANETLDFSLLSRELSVELGNVSDRISTRGCFLLEVAIQAQTIFEGYSRQNIVQAIAVLTKQKDITLLNTEISQLCNFLQVRAKQIKSTWSWLSINKFPEEASFYETPTPNDSQ